MPERAATSLRWPALILALVLALIAGFGLGRATGDQGSQVASAAGDHTHAPATAAGAAGHSHGSGAGTAGGLAISDAAYRLVPEQTTFVPGRGRQFRFTIVDTRARPVTNFTVLHERPLHLIVVRRDLSGFQHLHPTMAAGGTWSIPLTLPTAGAWRAYADFTATVDGKASAAVLGVDLTAAGAFRPLPLPAAGSRATVGGFQVAYEGTPRAGAVQPLLFRVTGDGAPATVEPYLGAYGHLVVLREGDLGYVHVHPEAAPVGGAVKFWLTAPSAGRYRMFLDFQVAGRVHTAEFTLVVPS